MKKVMVVMLKTNALMVGVGDVPDEAEMMGSRFRVSRSHMGMELFLRICC